MSTTVEAQIADRPYIGGEWVAPADPTATIEVVNPATEEVIGRIPAGRPEDAVRAVQAARQAFPSWSPTPLSDRLAVIERVGFVLSERLEQIGLLISQEVGMLGGHARDVHRA
jgi:acyl-CoA reductase-like NAD-dependent aldehyde dehydrogenase